MKKLVIKKGANSEDIQEMNRSLILQLVKKYGVCSRAQLAKDTGLKQASITKIIAGLIQLGILQEVGIVEGKKGRRSIGISINSTMHKILAVKLARSSFSVGLYDISGHEYKVYTESLLMAHGSSFALKRMKEVVREFLSEQRDAAAIGIAIPGPYIKSNESIAHITEFPGWEAVNLQEDFSKEFCLPVFVEHDANAGALAEWWFGEHPGDSNVMVYISVSEGVGAGIISHGQLFYGSQGVAGEIGHMSIDFNGRKCSCGNSGCLEKYCSTLALVKDTLNNLHHYPKSMLNGTKEITLETIIKAMKQGDVLATTMIEKVAVYLGYGIVNLVNIYNPNLIVISDGIAKGGETVLQKIRETIKPRLLPSLYDNLTIQLSKFSKDPILYGAAAIATDNFLKNPTAYLASS